VSSPSHNDFAPPSGRGGAQRIPRPAGAVRGASAPWSALVAVGGSIGLHDLVQAARRYRPAVVSDQPGTTTSAVLAGLVDADDGPAIILTKRAAAMRQHSGELSFPGGRVEPGESLVEAALRETFEEIGTSPVHIDVVGQLDPLTTVISSALIHPVVAVVRPVDGFRPHPDEVEQVLVVPIDELTSAEVYRQELWTFGGVERPIHFFELVGETLWGATARALVQLLTLGTQFALEVRATLPMDDG
jgi:8-oxo-dGTP pyrophosphatase MutT (NUDIX family)